MQRRELASMLAATTASAMSPFGGIGAEPGAPALLPRQYDRFEDWLTSARAAGMAFLKEFGAADTERFMRLLSLWVCAMPDPPEPAWQSMKGANASLDMATVSPGRPFVVSAFRMAPGCVLPLHCHPGGGGITLCTQGSLVIQHFELCEDQPPFSQTGASAEVRHVQIAQLARHHATMFTPALANLHQFYAGPEGATGVEIAVQWQGGGEFSFLRLHEPASISELRAGQRLKGTWVGMELASAYS
jgi:hypothetical protein